MNITIDSARKSATTLAKQHPGAQCIDVTSRGVEPWVRFSPFFPHSDIPVPLSPGHVSASVEGIWQGLKVFERADVDLSRFEVKTMRGLKRTVQKFGSVRGHRAGVGSPELLTYAQARLQIYLPAYRWVLEHRLSNELRQLQDITQPIVLLDYETNAEVADLTRPLSHASLIAAWLTERWPTDAAPIHEAPSARTP